MWWEPWQSLHIIIEEADTTEVLRENEIVMVANPVLDPTAEGSGWTQGNLERHTDLDPGSRSTRWGRGWPAPLLLVCLMWYVSTMSSMKLLQQGQGNKGYTLYSTVDFWTKTHFLPGTGPCLLEVTEFRNRTKAAAVNHHSMSSSCSISLIMSQSLWLT